MTDQTPQLHARLEGRLGEFSLNVNTHIPLHGVTAILGPSGSGKTSLLRCLAGLARLPGRISVANDSWQDDDAQLFVAPHHRQIGYVFQEASLFSHLSVEKNLAFGRRRRQAQGANTRLSTQEIVDLLSLQKLLKRYPQALSGGERQRVAIGRALLSHPRLLLMDEPLTALDKTRKEEILRYLEMVKETVHIPIVYVTHDISEVTRLADHIVLINEGQISASGNVNSMLERLDLHPATGRFEAGVILEAIVAAQDADYHLTILDYQGQQISIPKADLAIGTKVRLRIRARDVSLALEKPAQISIRNSLQGRITQIMSEPNTAFAETLVDVGGRKIRARVTRKAVADLNLASGTKVYALIKSISFDSRAVASAGQPSATASGRNSSTS